MEPNNSTPPNAPENEQNNQGRPTYPDFSAEGIDIVKDSGIAEDNEFGKVDNATPTPATPVPPPSPAPTEPTPPPATVPPPEPPRMETPPPAPIEPITKPPAYNPYIQTPIPATPPKAADQKKPEPVNDPSIKPLRTFKSDAEEAVKYQNVSAIDIAIAEQRKKEANNKIVYEKEKTSSPGMFVMLAILIMLLTAGGWYYWFVTSQKTVVIKPIPTEIKTIIPHKDGQGETITLESGGDPLTIIATKLKESNAGLGNIYSIVPTTGATSTKFAPMSEVFANTNIPGQLLRSLTDNYMFGIYTYDASSPFIILRSTYYQNAFSGMLDWEESMREDLMPLIVVGHAQEASSVPYPQAFQDAVVSNVDTRVLKNPSGDVILAYAFPDNDTIVITTNLNALKYILDKLLSVRTIQ